MGSCQSSTPQHTSIAKRAVRESQNQQAPQPPPPLHTNTPYDYFDTPPIPGSVLNDDYPSPSILDRDDLRPCFDILGLGPRKTSASTLSSSHASTP